MCISGYGYLMRLHREQSESRDLRPVGLSALGLLLFTALSVLGVRGVSAPNPASAASSRPRVITVTTTPKVIVEPLKTTVIVKPTPGAQSVIERQVPGPEVTVTKTSSPLPAVTKTPKPAPTVTVTPACTVNRKEVCVSLPPALAAVRQVLVQPSVWRSSSS